MRLLGVIILLCVFYSIDAAVSYGLHAINSGNSYVFFQQSIHCVQWPWTRTKSKDKVYCVWSILQFRLPRKMLGFRFKNSFWCWKASNEKWMWWNNVQFSIYSSYKNVSVDKKMNEKSNNNNKLYHIRCELKSKCVFFIISRCGLVIAPPEYRNRHDLTKPYPDCCVNFVKIDDWDEKRCQINASTINNDAKYRSMFNVNRSYSIELKTGFIDDTSSLCVAADHIFI